MSERRIRRAARILLLDEQDRLLLIRFAPADRRPFWCGVGGECDPGEEFHVAAVRELFEETGLVVDSCGPEVARREDDYLTFEGEPITSDERFFASARRASHRTRPVTRQSSANLSRNFAGLPAQNWQTGTNRCSR